MRWIVVIGLLAAVATAQEQRSDPVAAVRDCVVGVQARRMIQMRGNPMPANVRQMGVVVGKGGLVLTPSLGEGAEDVQVFLPGSAEAIDAEVVESDDAFTLLRAGDLDAEPLEFAKEWRPRVGDRVTWIAVLAGDVGLWTPVGKTATVDALLESALGAPDVYSDPPFSGPVTALGALLLDAEGRPVGVAAARVEETPGQGRGMRAMMMGRNSIPVVRTAAAFGHLLGGAAMARGVLGVNVEPLQDKVAEALGLGEAKGVLVTQVTPGSGAAAAGIRAQDVITAVAGTSVASPAQLQLALRGRKDGETVKVGLVRIGAGAMEVDATLTARVDPDKVERYRARRFGFVAEPITPAVRSGMGLPAGLAGLHVRRVSPGSPAALAQPTPLRRGDVILKVGGTDTPDLDALRQALEAIPAGKAVTLFVRHGSETRFVEVRPEEER